MRSILMTAAACAAMTLTSCSGLMMSVNDRDGSNESVVLQSGDQVTVTMPTFSSEAQSALAEAEYSSAKLASMLQEQMVSALKESGIQAQAGYGGASSLQIHITDYSYGSGAARVFLGGLAGDSDLSGVATLRTEAGTRELEVEKTGSQSGTTEGGDQTPENVGYFTTALASQITAG